MTESSADEFALLRRAFDRRGEQLVHQRLGFTDSLADLLRENEELRARLEREEGHSRDLHEALVAAHRQLEDEHNSLTFRVANKASQVYRRIRRR